MQNPEHFLLHTYVILVRLFNLSGPKTSGEDPKDLSPDPDPDPDPTFRKNRIRIRIRPSEKNRIRIRP